MEQRLWMILQVFGGAALFLYSMDTLTDALQQAAGNTLRQALARLTAHPLAGVLTGAAVTAVVQSSSAVTVRGARASARSRAGAVCFRPAV